MPLSEDEEAAIQIRRIPGGKAAQQDALKIFDADRQAALRDMVENGRDAQLERAMDLLKAMNVLVKRDGDKAAPPAKKKDKPVRSLR